MQRQLCAALNYTGDIADDTLRQLELYGASYITVMGDSETNLLMDYHAALDADERRPYHTGLTDFTVCRLSLDPFTDEVVQTFWSGSVVAGKATAFLREEKSTNLHT